MFHAGGLGQLGRHIFLKSLATGQKIDQFQAQPSKYVMWYVHWSRKISAAVKWSKVHFFESWIQTQTIVPFINQQSTALRR